MRARNNTTRNTRLGIETLEDRTVPTVFGSSGGLSIAVGDVLWAGGLISQNNQMIIGAGPGEPGIVKIENTSNQVLQSFYPFGTSYTGGITVATGDATGDGHDDLVVGTGGKTVGTVEVYEYINGGLQRIAKITPFGATYSGGVDVAVGNVTGQVAGSFNPGVADNVVVGEMSGGATVKVYGYDDSDGKPTYDQLRSFVAYPNYTGGVSLTVGAIYSTSSLTLNTDQQLEQVITGKAASMPEVAIWNVQNTKVVRLADYMAFNTSVAADRAGINVVAGDTDDILGSEIFVNLKGTGIVEALNGQTSQILATVNTYPSSFGTMVNFAVGGLNSNTPTQDDYTDGFAYVRDLVVVSANCPLNLNSYQMPVAFLGALFSPATLNGTQDE
jgi:hypothetical protein